MHEGPAYKVITLPADQSRSNSQVAAYGTALLIKNLPAGIPRISVRIGSSGEDAIPMVEGDAFWSESPFSEFYVTHDEPDEDTHGAAGGDIEIWVGTRTGLRVMGGPGGAALGLIEHNVYTAPVFMVELASVGDTAVIDLRGAQQWAVYHSGGELEYAPAYPPDADSIFAGTVLGAVAYTTITMGQVMDVPAPFVKVRVATSNPDGQWHFTRMA